MLAVMKDISARMGKTETAIAAVQKAMTDDGGMASKTSCNTAISAAIAPLVARLSKLEEKTKGALSCDKILTTKSYPNVCVYKVTKSNSVLWINRNYGWTTAPSQLLSGHWTYVRVNLDGTRPCANEGGWKGQVTETTDIAICCANHCGKTNLPYITGDASYPWYKHSGSFSITQHGGSPCTFYEAKGIKPGNYEICCSSCWASGVFFGQGDDTPPSIDEYDIKVTEALSCADVQNKRGGQYGSCQYKGAKIGAVLWSNRNYAFKGGPKDMFDGTWTYNKVHLNGGPCAREGGFEGRVKKKAVVAICCANHCRCTNYPTGGDSAWTKHSGVFAITQHGGSPCTFYESTLQPNKDYKICCSCCWGSGALFAVA